MASVVVVAAAGTAITTVIPSALQHGTIMSGHDLAVLAGWAVGGLLVSFRYLAWDRHRPRHPRASEASTTLRSA